MQSPFKIFRRYQKWFLVALAALAMISFGVGDIVMRMSGAGRSAEGAVVVETDVGNITQRSLQDLVRRRSLANRFMYRAKIAVHPEWQNFPPMLLGRIAQNFGNESPGSVIFSWLLRHEARRMGIVVDDARISKLIDQETSGKLSTDQFRKIIGELSISGKELYDILRDELVTLDVSRLTFPIATQTPEQYWRLYQQLHTREKIEVAPLPVKDFADSVDAPSEGQIASFFDKHKATFETSSDGEYRPGFRQPQKVRLHYLQLTYTGVEADILKERPISDKEIEDYYEAKKLLDRRLQETETAPLSGDETPIEPEIAPEGSETPQGPSLDSTSPDTPNDAAPSKGERPAPPAEPQNEPAPETPSDTSEGEGTCGAPVASGIDDDPQPAENEETAAPDAAAKPTTDTPAEKPAEKAAASEEGDAAPESNTPEEGDVADAEPRPAIKPAVKAPKFKPLDEELREMIRESIVHERTDARLQELSRKAAEALRDFGLQLAQRRDLDLAQLKPEDIARVAELSAEEMKKIAEKFGLQFGDTDLVNARQLSELPGIGKAQEPGSSQFSPGGIRTIVDMAFESESLCRVLEAEGDGTGADPRDRYVFWKVQDVASHVPTLDEPGVKDEVIEAWKIQHSIPETQKRAEALAEIIRSGHATMSDALSGQTVTGDPKGSALTVQESPEFSWWRESLVPQMGSSRPPVQLGNPVVVTGAGMKFMGYVFDELKEGETGVVFNDDASVCYVVRVISRRPADREAFKNAPVFSDFSPYGRLAEFDQQVISSEFIKQLEKRYGVKRHEAEEVRAAFDDE